MNGSLLLWAATMRTKSFDDRLRAAVATGAREMSLFPIDYKTFTQAGLTPSDMRAQMADAGVRVSVIDPLTTWLPDSSPPPDTSEADLEFTQFSEAEILEMAETLGAESINVIESFGAKLEFERIVESFAGVCDRARSRGLRVTVEFMPFSTIKDLATAWNIVRAADRKNGGLTFDTWHYFRGTRDDELLRSIPGEKIFRVQLADARKAVEGSLMNDLLHHRLPPGDGTFALTPLLTILDRIKGLRSVGPELFSDASDALSATDAAHQAVDASRRVLSQAGIQATL